MKAILVIDKPRYCEECRLCCRDSEEGYFCAAGDYYMETLNTYGEEDPRYHTIRKGCPLISVDEVTGKGMNEVLKKVKGDGWKETKRFSKALPILQDEIKACEYAIEHLEGGISK